MVEQMSRLPSAGVPNRSHRVAVAFLLLGLCGGIQAADDVVVEQVERSAGTDEDQENLHALDDQFDQTVFGEQPGWARNAGEDSDGGGGAGGIDIVATASRLADRRLASIERICGLSPAQVRALRLAMESDIRRMADAVGRERAKYAGLIINLNDQEGQRRFNLLQQDAARSRERVKNLFDAGSLFRKSLPAVLDEAQAGRLVASRDQQRAQVWKTLVLTVMLEVDERLGLDQAQADAVERILLEKVPPLRVENPPAELDQQHMQQMLVYAMLAEADQKRLKAAVSARQWRSLSQYIGQGRSIRTHLEQQGVLEKVVKPAR